MVREAKNLIVGLDVGTSKIVAIVAEVTPEQRLNIIGLGTQPSRRLKKGVVVNIEATMASIQRVLEEAELMAVFRPGVDQHPLIEQQVAISGAVNGTTEESVLATL